MDDKEESVSLWHRPSVESVASVDSLPSIPPEGSSIRLVQRDDKDDLSSVR